MPKDTGPDEITPDILLRAYALGIFPMADGRDDPAIHWIDPRRRGILPMEGFRPSRSLARRLRRGTFRFSADRAFAAVVSACADRDETWISRRIEALYERLFAYGHAHSIEVWQGDRLVGGIYGVTLGAAFFGESMFSRVTDASKAALAQAVKGLRSQGFRLFDTQFLTPHLASLGGIEVPRAAYHRLLEEALAAPALFDPAAFLGDYSEGPAASGSAQDSTQTS
jgi:leucyl/phenylalanyl-tRNA--protein transferase